MRAALPEDLSTVQRMLAAANLPADGLEEQFPDGYVILGEAGAAQGAAGVERFSQAGLLRSVVVDGTLRSHGLGRRIVEDRIAWARAAGMTELFLLTTTAADFFSHLGFERVDRATVPELVRASVEFASACPASAICMRKTL